MTLAEAQATLELLGKWRAHFAGWLFGTRPKGDPQGDWARDNTEKVLMARVELSALAGLLIEHGIITAEEFTIRVGEEARYLIDSMEERWPGILTTTHGLSYDIPTIQRAGWMARWLP